MQSGNWDFFHLRKPAFSEKELSGYLDKIPTEILSKTVLHLYPHLTVQYAGIKGYNLPFPYRKHQKKIENIVSVGCHNFNEIELLKTESSNLSYVFLSSVFQSISKENYTPKYSRKELKEFLSGNDFPFKIIALGGITENRQTEVLTLGFDGFAVLGDFWKNHSMR